MNEGLGSILNSKIEQILRAAMIIEFGYERTAILIAFFYSHFSAELPYKKSTTVEIYKIYVADDDMTSATY